MNFILRFLWLFSGENRLTVSFASVLGSLLAALLMALVLVHFNLLPKGWIP